MDELKLKRKHKSGHLKIKDRKPALDSKGKAIKDKYTDVVHRLSPDAFGKPFEVNDLKYVLECHGAILEKA